MTDKELINGIIDFWGEDTMFDSSISTDHPAFDLIKRMGKETVITTILERIQKSIIWFFVILYDIVPKEEQPEFLKEYEGDIEAQIKMWLDWGKEKGYIK